VTSKKQPSKGKQSGTAPATPATPAAPTAPATPATSTIDFEAIARAGADAAEDKKATQVQILNLGETSPICDYFVLASGKTRIQTRAIANAIDEKLKGVPIQRRRQGYQAGGWILLDYGGVVFHVLLERERDYYDLEGLWSKAPVIYKSEPAGD